MKNYWELIRDNPNLFDNSGAYIKIITDKDVVAEWEIKKKLELIEKGDPESWAKIGIVYNDPYIMIIRDLVKLPSGQIGTYFRIINSADLEGGHASVILPLLQDRIVISKQFRHPTRKWHWEIPRGFGEPGLSAQENAIKELEEEIQGRVSKIISLGMYHSNTGTSSAEVELFLAELDSIGKTNRDEGIESLEFKTIAEFEEMISSGIITDGFTIAAYTRAKLANLI